MPKKIIFSKKETQELINLYKKYKSAYKVEKNVKCQSGTIYKILKENNVKIIKKYGKYSSSWKGGKDRKTKGYILVYQPLHPFNRNSRVCEHRLIMEQHLGRYLKVEEQVHHINSIRDDNRIENLYLCKDKGEHARIHHLERMPVDIIIKVKNNKLDTEIGMAKKYGISRSSVTRYKKINLDNLLKDINKYSCVFKEAKEYFKIKKPKKRVIDLLKSKY